MFVHSSHCRKPKNDWCLHSRLTFMCIHTSPRDICTHIILQSCVIELLTASYRAMSICFPYAQTGRVNSKSFYQHKIYNLLNPLSSGRDTIPKSTFSFIIVYYNSCVGKAIVVLLCNKKQYCSLILVYSTWIINYYFYIKGVVSYLDCHRHA